MPIWEAALLGVIQGLTEFLPISSTAHLLVARQLLEHGDASNDAFTVVIQLGTLAAVFAYFRVDIVRMLKGLVADIRARRFGSTEDSRLGWLIVLGSVPVVLVGYFFKPWLKATFFNPASIAVVAIVFALLMAASEWWSVRRARNGAPRAEADIGWRDAVWVGLFQALALMPGGSRSGATITAGLFAGLARPAAARFSFLLSLPAILGAGLKEMYDERAQLFAPGQVAPLVVGLLVSAAVGYLAIALLLRILKRYSTAAFVVYRLLFAAVIFALLAAGVLK